ncbi:P-type conjugative transfer protein TrbJ [Tardibacter chloracetimidivorans]|uniref:P-type conjugative transfer protein TrbJ n=1 Tax=Tardibacter chloracetimidivorans TaxID=1921510 RepID=A0A1L3ZSK2_9SPHN|nr:P-type conjugative transfer protein TrbJ [Tardibacter chloracetimidivorans]API58604.1 P-type conjugative transfer protein TrbJ [Tardibacter chloracetimidivorans]
MPRIPLRKYAIASALGLSATGALIMGVSMTSTPASAQMSVFDTSNYTQNLLTAARTLQQINNQIQSLQNEAQILINQGKNLSRIDFPQLSELRQRLQQIDQLMGQAQGIDFRIDQLDDRYRQLFPDSFDQTFRRDQRLARARDQLDTAMTSFRQTMGVQNRIVDNVRSDTQALAEIVSRSQRAEGGLQAQQATNQLLALTAKQQLQIQNLMAAQFRSESIEQARRGQIAREAQESTRRFLGDGKAYTPRQ